MSIERRQILEDLAIEITRKLKLQENVNINFICTHNSRRSHLAQIWSSVAIQQMAIDKVYCYSGGTEATAVFPKIIETLKQQGLLINELSSGKNPVYAVKKDPDAPNSIAFSKTYDHPINPSEDFIAVMTCDHADDNCPFIPGAKRRFAITYQDPKVSDGSADQDRIYSERSLQIRNEMKYVFEKVKEHLIE